jgi:SmpA / OmlA family
MDPMPRPGRFDLRWLARLALGLLLLPPAGLAGCSRSAGPAEHGAAAADAEWAWLQSAKKTLDRQRAELARAASAKAADGSHSAGTKDPAARQREVSALAGELGRRLTDFINADPPAAGEKLSGRRLAAIRMKSDEDIIAARAFITQGGDYGEAIDILTSALAVDPDNPRLRRELDGAKARRYMTAERFAQVKKGMTTDEVRALIGRPNLRDVRKFPDRNVFAWYYTRDPEGRAAAVWFAQDKDSATVYLTDFHAVEVGGEEADPAS